MTLEAFDALLATAPDQEVPLAVPLRKVLQLLRATGRTSALSCEQIEGEVQYRYRGQLLADTGKGDRV